MLLKAGVSAGVVAFIITRIDLGALFGSVRSIGFASIVAAIGISFLQNILCTYRWIWIQGAVSRRFEFWPGLRTNYAALCIGQCLPSFVGGDAYRMYWLYTLGHPAAQAVRGVVIDRVSAFLALILMLGVSVPWLLMRFDDTAALGAMWTILLAGLGGCVLVFSADLVPQEWRRWRLLVELATLASTARKVLLSPGQGLRVVGVSVAIHTLTALAMLLFSRDMELPLLFLDCFAVIPLLMLIAAMPISIAGWGVREGVMVAALSLLGIEASQAVAVALLLGCMALFSGVLGVLPLAFGPIRLSSVRLPAEASSH